MIVVVDKPSGLTSAEVVARVKCLLQDMGAPSGSRRHGIRVGHTGTLDPMASGVLPIVVGEATKLAPFLIATDKQYRATVRFGAETDTQDALGRTTEVFPVSHINAELLRKACEGFTGRIAQVPPMYAALKVAGRPLYSYARAGVEVERASRAIVVHRLELLSFDDVAMTADMFVHCSKGTYVRTLAVDLARSLGSGAHLIALRRLASGPFLLEHAVTLKELTDRTQQGKEWPLIPPRIALSGVPIREVSAPLAHRVSCGQKISWSELAHQLGADGDNLGACESGPVALVDEHHKLVAVIERTQDKVRILRGFSPPLALD